MTFLSLVFWRFQRGRLNFCAANFDLVVFGLSVIAFFDIISRPRCKPDLKMDYSSCILFEKGNCNQFLLEKCRDLVSFKDLTLDISVHCAKLKVRVPNYSEADLVRNRIGINCPDSSKICPYHRFSNGIFWQPPNSCQHPQHTNKKTKMNTDNIASNIWVLHPCLWICNWNYKWHRVVKRKIRSWMKIVILWPKYGNWSKSHPCVAAAARKCL